MPLQGHCPEQRPAPVLPWPLVSMQPLPSTASAGVLTKWRPAWRPSCCTRTDWAGPGFVCAALEKKITARVFSQVVWGQENDPFGCFLMLLMQFSSPWLPLGLNLFPPQTAASSAVWGGFVTSRQSKIHAQSSPEYYRWKEEACQDGEAILKPQKSLCRKQFSRTFLRDTWRDCASWSGPVCSRKVGCVCAYIVVLKYRNVFFGQLLIFTLKIATWLLLSSLQSSRRGCEELWGWRRCQATAASHGWTSWGLWMRLLKMYI